MDTGAFGKDDIVLDQVIEALELLEFGSYFSYYHPMPHFTTMTFL
jgi:hypothetical protein